MWDKIVYCLLATALSFGVTYLVALLLFCFSRPKRRHFGVRFSLFIVFYLIIDFLSEMGYYGNVFEFSEKLVSFSQLMQNELRIPMVCVLLIAAVAGCILCFRMTWKDILFFGTASYLIQHIPVSIYAMYLSLDLLRSSYIFALIYVVLYVVFYFIAIRRIRREEVETSNNTLVATSALAAVVIFLFEFIYQINASFTANFYKSTCCIIMLLLMFGYFRESKVKKENVKLEYMIRAEQKHYEELQANMEIINIKCHDMKYQISHLKNVEQEADRQKLIDQLTRDIDIYGNSNLTENNALNVILSEKNLLCNNFSIKLYCIIDGDQLNFMEDADIYSLFGNALDNAIEYVKDVQDIDKRNVYVYVRSVANFVSIHIENYFEGTLQYDKNNQIVTSKGDKTIHGFGLRSIEYIVKKYNGEISIGNKNNAFVINIAFPQKEF
jgi:hypothetical protein